MKLSKVISLGLAIAVLLAVAVPPGHADTVNPVAYFWYYPNFSIRQYYSTLPLISLTQTNTTYNRVGQWGTFLAGPNLLDVQYNYYSSDNESFIRLPGDTVLKQSGYLYSAYGVLDYPSNTTSIHLEYINYSPQYVKNFSNYKLILATYNQVQFTPVAMVDLQKGSSSSLSGVINYNISNNPSGSLIALLRFTVTELGSIEYLYSPFNRGTFKASITVGSLEPPPEITIPPSPTDPPPETSIGPDATWVTANQFQTFADYQNTVLHYISLVDASISVLLQDDISPKLNIIELALSSISGFLLDDVKPGIESLNNTLTEINNKLDSLPSGGSTDLTNIENQLDELIDTQATEQERQMSEGAESLRDGYNAIFTENDNPIDTKDFMGLGIIAHFFDSLGNGSQLNPVTQALSGDWWNIWDNLDKSFEEASNYVYDPGG